jgi:Cu(I)/Ag(I) efflux system membrane fusion protein
MKHKTLFAAIAAAVVLGAGGYGLYALGMQRGLETGASEAAEAGQASAGSVLYWHDPMVPGQKFDRPGKSPFMDMPLVPVYAGGGRDDGAVGISPRIQQNLGIRTADVRRGPLAPALDVVGNVAYDERELVVVQARSGGFIERLHVRAPFEAVRKGQALAELYVPEWVAAQEEYFAVARMRGAPGSEGLLDAARQRMRLAGMPDELIRQILASGKTRARLTLAAPAAGVITELQAREGMTIGAGAALFRINGLRSVWVDAEVPEMLAARVRPGSPIEGVTPALPGRVLEGKVEALLPQLDLATRTLKARIALRNPGGRLVPGMFVSLKIGPVASRDVLQVPSEALIRTGERHVVILRQGDGRFKPVDVQPGLEADGRTEILRGLEEGQVVVVSGQFLIDSEASLKGTATRMGALSPPDAPSAQIHSAEGVIESSGADEIMLSHGPVPSLKWGAMTMGFKPPPGGLPKEVSVGDKVKFGFREAGNGVFAIVTISRTAGGAQ